MSLPRRPGGCEPRDISSSASFGSIGCVGFVHALAFLCFSLLFPPQSHARTSGGRGTLSLSDCIAFALEQHPALRSGAARLDAADARTRQTAAPYLPQVEATYSANRRSTSIAARTGTTLGTTSQTFNFFNTGVNFSQLLFDFGQTLHSLRAAVAQRAAIAADLATERATIVFQVQQAYFALLAAQQLVVVARQGVEQSQKHLELALTRLEVGLAPPLDVTRERAQLANNELTLLRAQNHVLLGQETLRNAVGMDETREIAIEDLPHPMLPALDEEQLLERAFASRPEILSLRAQQRAAAEQVAYLEKNHLPSLAANGQYQWSGSNYPLQSNWNIGATITLPLFQGGLTVAQLAEARAREAELAADEITLRNTIALEVRQAVLRAREAAQAVRVAERGVEQATENLALAEGRYETGVGSIIELTDAQGLFLVARGQWVESVQDLRSALAAIEKATAQPLGEPTFALTSPGKESFVVP